MTENKMIEYTRSIALQCNVYFKSVCTRGYGGDSDSVKKLTRVDP